MKYYIKSDCICSTNCAFNMKTMEKIFSSLFLQFYSSSFVTLHNYMFNTHKHCLHSSDGTEVQQGTANVQIAHMPCLYCNSFCYFFLLLNPLRVGSHIRPNFFL